FAAKIAIQQCCSSRKQVSLWVGASSALKRRTTSTTNTCGENAAVMLHEVITSEKVPLVFKVAGLGSRFLAWLVDLCLIIFLILVVAMLGQVYELAREGVGFAVAMVGTFVIQWGYFLLFEWLWHGQTPGKRLIGIRVIDREGTSISFGQAAVRNVLRV